MKKIKCLVLTPVGPNSNVEHVKDTVRSFLHYMANKDTMMLLIDDTRNSQLRTRIAAHENIRIIDAAQFEAASDRSANTLGRLFVKQMLALEQICLEYDWDCLMRLDDDALILGDNPHEDALAFFRSDKRIGLLGAYLRRGDGSNKEAAMREMGKSLTGLIFSRRNVCEIGLRISLLRVLLAAKRNSYRVGDMCTGGALFMTQAAYKGIRKMVRGHLHRLSRAPLPDDFLFALYVAAAGFIFSDFSDESHPMAVNWRGLPMPLEDLITKGKKVVHPVKDPQNLDHEYEVRAFFARHRGEQVK